MYQETIGLVGGFGGFATLDFFRRLLETFNTGYERDYPRIIMDNDFTMPSRTKALLYGDDIDTITDMMAHSVKNLMSCGADRIILVCGTAHWFLDGVYSLLPEAREKVVDIINTTGEQMRAEGIRRCYVAAAEGTMKRRLYNRRLADYGIEVSSPPERDWPAIRSFMEAVKQDKITKEVQNEFCRFLLERTMGFCDEVILGCTELPLLVNDEARERIHFIDPLECVLKYLKDNLK